MLYTIKQGKHYSSFSLQRLWIGYNTRELQFRSSFVNDPSYKFGNEDDDDVNKLYGLSFGLDPHKFSYRIGWNSTGPNSVGYYHYYYVNGKRFVKPIISLPSYAQVKFKICPLRDENLIQLWYSIGNIIQVTDVDFSFINSSKWSHKLFPYFGGNNSAPKEFKIDIAEYKGNFY